LAQAGVAKYSFLISNNNYICVVKIQRLLSTCLIFLVLLSSTDEAILADMHGKVDAPNTDLRFSELASSLSHDFRESLKMTLSEEKDNTEFVHHNVVVTESGIASILRYEHYYRHAHLSRRPSQKLFLDFGALII
jgi:hypothetical protein